MAAELKPNVVLVLVDSLRYDFVGAYSSKDNLTPAIDSLGEKGVVFETAIAQAPSSKMSVASVFTGNNPAKNNMFRRKDKLSDSALTMAKILKDSGYATIALTGNALTRADLGFAQGFDLFVYEKFGFLKRYLLKACRRLAFGKLKEDIRMKLYSPADSITLSKKALGIAGKQKQPFFLFVHYLDPHWPFGVPNYELAQKLDSTEKVREVYKDRVKRCDTAIDILACGIRKLSENTIFIVSADHGEMFDEHAKMAFEGKRWLQRPGKLFEERIRVPLVFNFPGLSGRRVKGVVRLIDVLPTVLELIGEKRQEKFDGASLVPAIRGEELGELHAFTDGDVGEDGLFGGAALRTNKWKIIKAPSTGKLMVFDLETDPMEKNDLSGKNMGGIAELERTLEEYLGNRINGPEAEMSEAEKDREITEQLRELGYVK
ncbi:MAG: sulfatase [Candidatus Diapherotrites archaeon]|nr:sulfatase [Candidatus Diapherotrites archaeon]